MTKKTTWCVMMHAANGSSWPVATGLSTREAADRALQACMAKIEIFTTTRSGRADSPSLHVEEEDS